jgi:hypothetical protein
MVATKVEWRDGQGQPQTCKRASAVAHQELRGFQGIRSAIPSCAKRDADSFLLGCSREANVRDKTYNEQQLLHRGQGTTSAQCLKSL